MLLALGVQDTWLGSEVYSHESETSKKSSAINQVLANMLKLKYNAKEF